VAMEQIIASNGLTVTMEAMLNHPVLKKDEISFPTGHRDAPTARGEVNDVIQHGLKLLWMMTLDAAQGYEERRVTLRKAGVLGVLPPVVAAFTEFEAEIKAGMHPDAEVYDNKVKSSIKVLEALVGKARLVACMNGEDPLSDMLTERDMTVLIGTREEPGFLASATAVVQIGQWR
jgi:hypothetical protein